MNTQMKAILVAGALVAASAYSMSSQAADQADSQLTNDQRITNAVVDKIGNDPGLSADGIIQVQTSDGDVTLTGRVDLPDQVDKAGLDAESVDGVKDVDNEVRPRVGAAFY
jgi:osmotically-inducible protein OsmY